MLPNRPTRRWSEPNKQSLHRTQGLPPGQRVEADGGYEISGVEYYDVVKALGRDMAEHFLD